MVQGLFGHDLVALALGAAAGLACGFLNTMLLHYVFRTT